MNNLNTNIGIVFINGAGLNSSIWDVVREKIHHPILAIDFPNRKAAGKSNASLTFDDYVIKTASEIQNWHCNSFVLVTHSIGACVGLKVAEQFKNQLKGFVAIGSVIPKSGQSFASTLPFPQKVLLPILMSLFGTKPPASSIEAELCNDLSPETTLQIVNEFTPESKALYTTKFTYELPESERLFVTLTNDNAIPTDLQDQMAKNLSATKVEIINSGHLPMLSKPEELAGILNKFISGTKF
ncbi:MAG: alpha/beta hydrolase [Balneolales bacterium]|nr:alpha/beta hydrolase [Balneolales bacterium]